MRGWAGARSERGFTIVELMVVLSVMGILIAIAIPTFVTAMWQAEERRAQTNLRAAAKAAFVSLVRHGEFDGSDAGIQELGEIEPAFTFVSATSPSTADTVISVAEDLDGGELALAVVSPDGDCFYLRLSSVTQESRHAATPAECRAVDYADGPNTGW